MIIGFVWPSTPSPIGGVGVLYEYANALSRRGHEVHFVHGPAWPDRIERVEDIGWFTFEPAIRHHIVDDLADPRIGPHDILFAAWLPPELGRPLTVVQGEGIMGAEVERAVMRHRMPKIVVASWLVEVGVGYGAPREQFRTICPGIDHDCFTVERAADERDIDVSLLYHPHPTKGWATAEAALALVKERRPSSRVVAFGATPPESPLPEWVEFRLAPSREELAAEVYNRSKVFLQASRNEGFGLTAVEAMACGAALVTTDNGGSADYAFDGRTATVVPQMDVAALAGAVDALLDDPERRASLAARGEQFVRRFTWDTVGEQAEALLVEYLADPDRFTGPPSPSDEPELRFELVYGALVGKPADD